jgi:hypothetical protein
VTEAEWLDSDDLPTLLFSRPQLKPSGRKVRLWACACVRRLWHQLADPRSRAVVEQAERHADGEAGRAELALAGREARVVGAGPAATAARKLALPAGWAVLGALEAAGSLRSDRNDLMRDVLGNPFRPAPVVPASALAWEGGLVVRLAEQAYRERLLPSGEIDPQRLAVLADALEEAGGTDADLLGHLRSPGPHVRGCWAIDRLLGQG